MGSSAIMFRRMTCTGTRNTGKLPPRNEHQGSIAYGENNNNKHTHTYLERKSKYCQHSTQLSFEQNGCNIIVSIITTDLGWTTTNPTTTVI